MKALLPLAIALPLLGLLGFVPPVPALPVALVLVIVLIVGDLWLGVLVREPIAPMARLGLATAAGLVTFPLVAITLHVLGIRIETRAIAAGVAVIAVALTGLSFLTRGPAGPQLPDRPLRIVAAVGIPGALALVIGGTAVLTYERLPHPSEPGYTSVALGGWATDIAHPVAFPAAGLEVPIRVSSGGQAPDTAPLQVQVGDRIIGRPFPVRIAKDATGSVRVHVPAPPDGCLHLIRISLGPASTVFYGRGPQPC